MAAPDSQTHAPASPGADSPGRSQDELGALVQQLHGPDVRARANARQRLPYAGTAAVPAMIRLLTHEDARVAQAAFDILMDIGNASCAPGREAERQRVGELLLPLVRPERPEKVRIQGLQLLALVAPAGLDLRPMQPLLGEIPVLREKARAALQRMGTPAARSLLRSALTDESDPRFRCALLTSLGELRDAASLDAIQALTGNADASVRAAAVRALSWTGDPAHAETMRQVAAQADDQTRADVMDAWLRLGEAMAAQPAHRAATKQLFLGILSVGKGIEKIGALVGLGGVGDANCVAAIKDAAKDANPRVRATADRVLAIIDERSAQHGR